MWGGKRIDPLSSLDIPGASGSDSACEHLGWQWAALGREGPLPGFVPGSLDSHMKGVWGPRPTLSVFLSGCFSPAAKGTGHWCRFPPFSLCSQRCFGFPEWKWPGFPERQHLQSSKTLHPLKCCGFLRILSTFFLPHLYMAVSYLESTFISAAIFLNPLEDHLLVFIFFPQRLPFS